MSDLTNLKNTIEQAKRYYSRMSPAEQAKANDEIRSLQSNSYKSVASEAIEALSNSAYFLQKANNAIREKKKKFANKFESGRLNTELSIASVLLDVALKGNEKLQALERLVNEVKTSGDTYKIKALYSVIPGALSRMNGLDEQLKVNHLKADLEPFIGEAIPSDDDKKQVYQAYEEYREQASRFRETASLLGENDLDHPLATSPMAKAFQKYSVSSNEFGLPDIREGK